MALLFHICWQRPNQTVNLPESPLPHMALLNEERRIATSSLGSFQFLCEGSVQFIIQEWSLLCHLWNRKLGSKDFLSAYSSPLTCVFLKDRVFLEISRFQGI